MTYQDLIAGMKRYGALEADICLHGLGVSRENVRENVVLAPWWEPATMPGLGKAQFVSVSDSLPIKAWNIQNSGIDMTYIKTGIGAPLLVDALLCLGVTVCKRILFIGSVGSLDQDIGIGDMVIPEYSICGDGVSRYLGSDDPTHDVFGEKSYPDATLNRRLTAKTEEICRAHEVRLHKARTFSIDTIFAQFVHIDRILAMGCSVIEMETAAAFRAAALMDIPLAALFNVSDNSVMKKSLVNGRSEEELEYRKYVRRELFPRIILSVFQES